MKSLSKNKAWSSNQADIDEPIVTIEKLEKAKKKIDEALINVFGKNKIKNILLINPPDSSKSTFDFDRVHRKRSSDYPPYGLLIVARNLIKNGYNVEILNLQHEIIKNCVLTNKKENFNLLEDKYKPLCDFLKLT